MAERQLPEPFVHALLECQDSLRAYLAVLVGDPYEANEVLQEVNLMLCQEADKFSTIENFTAWAQRIAYYAVLSARKRRARDRLLFDDELLALVADEAPPAIAAVAHQQQVLEGCLAELPVWQRDLILKRYQPGAAVKLLADELGRSAASLHQTLYRIRLALLNCMRRKTTERE